MIKGVKILAEYMNDYTIDEIIQYIEDYELYDAFGKIDRESFMYSVAKSYSNYLFEHQVEEEFTLLEIMKHGVIYAYQIYVKHLKDKINE